MELGMRYMLGDGGVSEDIKKGSTLIRQAAEQGVPEAQYFVGLVYE